ncbi:hypothetical protein [Rossellomorea marisflavi]|uniref:hypothetical protein n=1 Tax=Rossellomorea marisflavi TaxID=189381 RepID=UPI001653D80A|nr:hypothetical protein [Rossellomorea marisflavi]
MIYFACIGIGVVLMAFLVLMRQWYVERKDYFFWGLIFVVGVTGSYIIGKTIVNVLN